MPCLSNFPITSARVIKDMTYEDLPSHTVYTNALQEQHQN